MKSIKNISKIILTVAAFALSVQVALSQPATRNSQLTTLNLEEFLSLAKANALSAEAAKTNLDLANLNYKIFKSNLKPNLTGMANLPNFSNTFAEVLQDDGTIAFQPVTNNNSTVGLQLTQNVGATGGQVFATSNLQRFDDFNTDKSFYNGSPIRVGFWQPLFGFNQVKRDKAIEPMRLTEAEKKYANDLENINREAAQLFFNLLIANENLKIAQSNKSSNETLFSIAEEKFNLGKISKSDLLALQLELVSAKAEEKQATQSVRAASSTIYTYLGRAYDNVLIQPELPVAGGVALPFSAPLELREEQANPNRSSSGAENGSTKLSPQASIKKALTNRPEPISYARQLAEAEFAVKEARANSGFQADLTASFGLSRGSEKLGDIYSDPQPQQFAALQLSVPIMDWGRSKSTVGLAKAQRDFLQKSIERDRLQFNAEIEQTVATFNSLQSELVLAEEMRDLAQQRFDITSQSFALGAISITDLTLAQREKDRALRGYVVTLGRYWGSYFALRALTGGE